MSQSVVDIFALKSERHELQVKCNQLLSEISALVNERASVLKRIRLLTYRIEYGDQEALPLEPVNLNDIKGKK